MPNSDLQLGADADIVSVRLNGKDISNLSVGGGSANRVESYEVKVSVFQQPAAFTLRLSRGATAEALLAIAQPGTPFELFIGGNKIQSGLVYDRGVPTLNANTVEITGRDYLARLFDDEIQDELHFDDKTYFALTRKVLNVVGLKEQPSGKFKLLGDNESNREIVAHIKAKGKGHKRKKTQLVEEIETGAGAGGSRLVYRTLKATVGTTYYNFLQEQYKLAGLFLWATGDGQFVLARPTADQDPAYKIVVEPDQPASAGRATERVYHDRTTQRHSACICYGRAGSGESGRSKVRGYYVDEEMTGYGFDHVRTVHDEDVQTQAEADYVARRTIAEERRRGFQLEYTLSGHVQPYLGGAANQYAIWAPDMIASVADYELGLNGPYYIQDVTYRRAPQTQTIVSLMRPQDMIYAEGLY